MVEKSKEKIKVETVEEFLARGGKIEVIPAIDEEPKLAKINTVKNGPPHLMTLGEGEFWFGEKSTRRKKKKEQDFSKVDMSLVPDDLIEQLGLSGEKTSKSESSKK